MKGISKFQRGFTLVELLVVIAIIGALAALLMPVFSKVKAKSKGAKCISNLNQLGVVVRMYAQENEGRMPVMYDRIAGGQTNRPSMDVVLSAKAGGAQRVFRCPADYKGIYRKTGSSYSWNVLLNNQPSHNLRMFQLVFDPTETPVFFDKEKFHIDRGPGKGKNYLYAAGNIKNLLVITGTR